MSQILFSIATDFIVTPSSAGTGAGGCGINGYGVPIGSLAAASLEQATIQVASHPHNTGTLIITGFPNGQAIALLPGISYATVTMNLIGQSSTAWQSFTVTCSVTDLDTDELRFMQTVVSGVVTGTVVGSPPIPWTPPIPPPDPLKKEYKFSKQPPAFLNYASSNTLQVEAVYASSQTTFLAAASQIELNLVKASSLVDVGASSLTNSSSVNVTSIIATMSSGLASFVLSVPSAAVSVGQYAYKARCLSSCVADSPIYSITSRNDQVTLQFSVQPPTTVQVQNFWTPAPAVAAVNTLGATSTTFTTDITIKPVLLDGITQASGNLIPTSSLTQSPTNGVSTFSGLRYTQTGRITLRASADDKSCISDPIIVTGVVDPADFSGLRQNKRDDGTKFIRTSGRPSTNTSTVSSALSYTDKYILDGDLAVTAGVTIDGVRHVHPNTISLKRVRVKGILSALTSSPTIDIWASTDTSSGTDGTWTKQTSITPSNVNVNNAFEFATPVYAKGIWVTLDNKGGAATMNWQAMHITGPYLGPLISLMDLGSLDTVKDEETLSIPKPARKLGSGQSTVVRAIGIRNNASAATIIFRHEAARYNASSATISNNTDTLMGSAHITLMNATGGTITSIVVASNAVSPVQIQYTIASSENDASGKHYERFSLLAVQPGNIYATSTTTPSSAIELNSSGTLVREYQPTTPTSKAAPSGVCVAHDTNELYFLASSALNSSGTHTIVVFTIGSSSQTRTLKLNPAAETSGTTGFLSSNWNSFTHIAYSKGVILLTNNNGTGSKASSELLIDSITGIPITSYTHTKSGSTTNPCYSDQEHGRFFTTLGSNASQGVMCATTTGGTLWFATNTGDTYHGYGYDYVSDEFVRLSASATNQTVTINRVAAATGVATLSGSVTGEFDAFAGTLKMGVYVHPTQGEYWMIQNSGNSGTVYQRTIRISSGIGTKLFNTSSTIGTIASLQPFVVPY